MHLQAGCRPLVVSLSNHERSISRSPFDRLRTRGRERMSNGGQTMRSRARLTGV